MVFHTAALCAAVRLPDFGTQPLRPKRQMGALSSSPQPGRLQPLSGAAAFGLLSLCRRQLVWLGRHGSPLCPQPGLSAFFAEKLSASGKVQAPQTVAVSGCRDSPAAALAAGVQLLYRRRLVPHYRLRPSFRPGSVFSAGIPPAAAPASEPGLQEIQPLCGYRDRPAAFAAFGLLPLYRRQLVFPGSGVHGFRAGPGAAAPGAAAAASARLLGQEPALAIFLHGEPAFASGGHPGHRRRQPCPSGELPDKCFGLPNTYGPALGRDAVPALPAGEPPSSLLRRLRIYRPLALDLALPPGCRLGSDLRLA